MNSEGKFKKDFLEKDWALFSLKKKIHHIKDCKYKKNSDKKDNVINKSTDANLVEGNVIELVAMVSYM